MKTDLHRQSVYLLVLSVATLVAIGLVMLYSTSAFAADAGPHQYAFLKKQSMWLGIGLIACVAAARLDYHFWRKTWYVWFALAIVLLIMCYVPHLGQKINGSRRWINLRFASFQPSELGKIAAITALAWWFSRDEKASGEFVRGFIWPGVLCGIIIALILPEVDMGSTALIGATSAVMMYVAGTRLRFMAPLALTAVTGLGFILYKMPERLGRLLAFWYPEKYPADAYQAQQGLIALGSGGTEGVGLGLGRQKLAYLPFAHTDFIFPMIGEELGLRFTLLVVFAYVIFIMAAGLIVVRARDKFGMLLGLGFTLLIALQAAVNIGVTTELLPNKGLPLPFISYGGSNLVFCLVGTGVLVNIYRQGLSDKEVRQTRSLEARVRTKQRRHVEVI
jgi:cell division protein FtsW